MNLQYRYHSRLTVILNYFLYFLLRVPERSFVAGMLPAYFKMFNMLKAMQSCLIYLSLIQKQTMRKETLDTGRLVNCLIIQWAIPRILCSTPGLCSTQK